jgi:hypothetical protein
LARRNGLSALNHIATVYTNAGLIAGIIPTKDGGWIVPTLEGHELRIDQD